MSVNRAEPTDRPDLECRKREKAMSQISTSTAAGCAVLAMAVLVQGCAGGAGEATSPQAQHPEFRTAVATAPADLQLACASEVAEVFEVSQARVLPIASGVEEDETYTVVVNADGTHAICAINEDGVILSVEEA
jgi:hypothetical protein